jgi:HSP20 family protein
MDHLFDEAFARPFGLTAGWQALDVDLYQTEEQVVVKATLPGIKAEDVQVSLSGDLLSLKGEFKETVDDKQKSYHLRERRFGSFERILSLPVKVRADQAQAEYADGILTITLPKAESDRPKTITVRVK